jgi:hypothetical protein
MPKHGVVGVKQFMPFANTFNNVSDSTDMETAYHGKGKTKT